MGVFALYLDLAELDAGLCESRLFSSHHPAPLSLRRADYPGGADQPLDVAIRNLVERSCDFRPHGPIRLLTQPRVLGYGFNPVSFFYCFDASRHAVEAVVAHVTNTPWGERHCYVLRSDRSGDSTFHARHDKRFHVSPFMPMQLMHDFTFDTPGEELSVRIANVREGETVFAAALTMRRRALTAPALARVAVRYPLMSVRVTGAIYWHALCLRLKGAPFFAHPGAAIPAARNSR
jgi:DUF1365 family protein